MVYDILSNGDRDNLMMRVDASIKEGWKPQGGILYACGQWHQAMVKALT